MTTRLNGHDGDPIAAMNARLMRGEYLPGGSPKRHRGEGIIDPRSSFDSAPPYKGGMLPQIFEDYLTDCIASWGGSPEPYICAFLAMHCGVLHSSVKMMTNPLKPEVLRNPNDFSLTLGKSGEKKSGMFRDLTKHQEAWQLAMSRASQKSVGRGPKFRPIAFLQNASIEGMMMQIADNRGERLLLGCEEAMSFYNGAAAHRRDDSASAMSDAVCAVYDGGIYTKRLVSKVYDIPEALATLIMTTVFEKVVGWGSFDSVIESGLMARHTVGVMATPQDPDPKRVLPEAGRAMGDVLLKLRGLRDMRVVMSGEVSERWLSFRGKKEKHINEMMVDGAKPGLIAWCRKYEMRIVSMATIFQLYDYVNGGMIGATESILPPTEAEAGKGEGPRVLRTIETSLDNLIRAVDLVEGFLLDTQEFFYKVAAGVTEFGPELVNFAAYRVVINEPGRPDSRILNRGDLTSRGPSKCRGAITPELKETHKRWITALMDHGFIEVYDHPDARKERKFRADNEERWYKVRDEFYEHFNTAADLEWAKAHDSALKARMAANGIGPARATLSL